jgi:hypothetical protein
MWIDPDDIAGRYIQHAAMLREIAESLFDESAKTRLLEAAEHFEQKAIRTMRNAKRPVGPRLN